MALEQLIKQQENAHIEVATHSPILMTSRIRLARNLEGFHFPGWSDMSQRSHVYKKCVEAIEQVSHFNPCLNFSIESLDSMERQYLVERHLISTELSEGNAGSGVCINNDQSISIMINEEDHLRIQVMSPRFDFDQLWKTSDQIDTELERNVDYAYREAYGFLTACPTNLGTGLRASVMMHLPALVMTKQMEKVVRAVNQLGIVARGIFGESSDPSGSVFQISNQQTLGESEEAIILRIKNVILTIVEQEYNGRVKLFEKDGNVVLDRIYRAYGILKYANLLTSSESMNLLSMLRLASDIGMLPHSVRGRVDHLMMAIQPSHLQYAYGKVLESDERDLLRAERLREAMKDIPELDPSSISFPKPDFGSQTASTQNKDASEDGALE
jgi:protein arginine kinase